MVLSRSPISGCPPVRIGKVKKIAPLTTPVYDKDLKDTELICVFELPETCAMFENFLQIEPIMETLLKG